MTLRIITSPAVYLVGRQTIDDDALSRFLGDHDAAGWETDTDIGAEKLVEVAGRTCYLSFSRPRPGGNAAYIGHLLEVGHGSCLEHAVFNLIITGVSRSFTHELVRHRAGMSYSMLSQRYVDESECEFVVPPLIRIRPGETIDPDHYGCNQFQTQRDYVAFGIWLEAVTEAQKAYKSLVSVFAAKLDDQTTHPAIRTEHRKTARQAARSVLPNATETKIFVTANARALRTFLEQRGAREADAEMRRVAVVVCRLMQSEAPHLFSDFSIEASPSGEEFLSCQHHKV